MELSVRQKKFADLYLKTGNATTSYGTAYGASVKVCEVNGCKLLRNTKVMIYMAERNKILEKSTIADMVEVKEFWANTLRDKEMRQSDRLKASEFIAKTNGAFIEKIEAIVDANVKLELTLTEAEDVIKRFVK